MKKYILALDQGTTGTTAMIVNKDTSILSKSTVEFEQLYPSPGFVEQNPLNIWDSVKKAVTLCLYNSKINKNEIACIGLTNQRETVLMWNKATGDPIHNAIVWQCRRTSSLCKKLKDAGLEQGFHKKTGLFLDPYFSGTKIQWLINNLKIKSFKNIACGTIDSFLVYKLTAGSSFYTEPSNASRTLLYNINSLSWDNSLAKILKVPLDILPKVIESSSFFGETSGLDFLPDGIPITGVLGDQQAALFGQLCFSKGDLKCTYGTGAFLLMNTGKKKIFSKNNLLTTIAWKCNGKVNYALEGSVFVAGAAVQWLRDGLKIIDTASEIEKLATRVHDTGGVYFVPALTGLGAPYWNPYATGLITGITRGTTFNHIARATLEGIAFQVYDLITAFASDMGCIIKQIKVDGGASENKFLMQFQSDILNSLVIKPSITETTAFGAALIAGITYGLWGKSEIKRLSMNSHEYSPLIPALTRKRLLAGWKRAIHSCNV